jgi:hypothetical protein
MINLQTLLLPRRTRTERRSRGRGRRGVAVIALQHIPAVLAEEASIVSDVIFPGRRV